MCKWLFFSSVWRQHHRRHHLRRCRCGYRSFCREFVSKVSSSSMNRYKGPISSSCIIRLSKKKCFVYSLLFIRLQEEEIWRGNSTDAVENTKRWAKFQNQHRKRENKTHYFQVIIPCRQHRCNVNVPHCADIFYCCFSHDFLVMSSDSYFVLEIAFLKIRHSCVAAT